MSEFGGEIIEFHHIMFDFINEKDLLLPYSRLVELFNNFCISNKHLKIYGFILTLYDYYFTNQQNLPLCKKVYNIIKDNFGDESLLSEYVF